MLHPPTRRRQLSMPEFPVPQPYPHIPAMPSHWRLEFKGAPRPLKIVLELAFQVLCLISLGHPDLKHVWLTSVTGDKTWTDQKDRLSVRISTITIIGGLLLGTTAAFATTTPPASNILNYTERGPYICVLCSFGLTLGGLIAGSAILFITSKCTAHWFCTTLMGSRSRICCTLVLISYPFTCIGVSTIVGAFGLLAAAWTSQDLILKIVAVWMLNFPVSLIFLFVWTQLPLRKNFTFHHGSSDSIQGCATLDSAPFGYACV